MTSLDRLHRGGQLRSMPGQNKYSDGFMDDTDREVSSLTDRAFRSLCIGEEAVYSDAEPISSPRDAFPVEPPATFQQSFGDISRQDQGLLNASLPANGVFEATWQPSQSGSMVSSFSKGPGMSLALDIHRSEAVSCTSSWEKSTLWSLKNKLSEFSTSSHDPFSKGTKLQNAHCLDPTFGSIKTQKCKTSTSTFRKLISINFFLHSEYSPFQTWEDYNRLPVQQEAHPFSSSSFHNWYDSPIYKDLTAGHRVSTTMLEEKKCGATSKEHRTPSEPPQSAFQHKAPAVEKRCESEMMANALPWRRRRTPMSNHFPANRPCTASPCSQTSRQHDEALFLGSQKSAVHLQVHTLMDEQKTNSTTPFNISQLLTPVIYAREETDTSEILEYEHSPTLELQTSKDNEPRSLLEVKLRDSYKTKASSLLFNLKDNRKRVKSTYNPTKFKSLELTDSNNHLSRQESAALADEKSINGLPGPGVGACIHPEAARARSVDSPASHPTNVSVDTHRKNSKPSGSDSYFTVISPPTVKDTAQHTTFNRRIQETVQEMDQLYESQRGQCSQTPLIHSKSNEVPLRDRSTQPTASESKTRFMAQEISHSIPAGGAVHSDSIKSRDNRREVYSVKESNAIRKADISKYGNVQNEIAVKNSNSCQGEKDNKSYPKMEKFKLNESSKSLSATPSLKEEQFPVKEPDRSITPMEKRKGRQGVPSLKDKSDMQKDFSGSVQRKSAEESVLPVKESERSGTAVTEVKEKGRVRKKVLKIQANETANCQALTKTQNPHLLLGQHEGTVKNVDKPQTTSGQKDNEPLINTLKTAQEKPQAVKQTTSQATGAVFPKQEQNMKEQKMCPGKSTLLANKQFTVQEGNPNKQSSVSGRQDLHSMKDTPESKAGRAQVEDSGGWHQAKTDISRPSSDSSVAVKRGMVTNKNVFPVEGFHWAAQSLQTIIKCARGGKMVSEGNKDGVRREDVCGRGEKGQAADETLTLEAEKQEKRQQFRDSNDGRHDVLIHEQMKMIQEPHLARDNEEGEDEVPAIKDSEGVAGDSKQETYEFTIIKKLDGVEKEMPSKTDCQAASNAMFTTEGKDQEKQVFAARENKQNGLAHKNNSKIKHRIFSFNHNDHALQELFTSRVKAYAQKEISAIKEKGLSKRVPPSTEHGTAANGNQQRKPGTVPRRGEYCRSDTFLSVEADGHAGRDSPPTVDKAQKAVSVGSSETKHRALSVKAGDSSNELQEHRNAAISRRDFTQKATDVINETCAKERDTRCQQAVTHGGRQKAHTAREIPEASVCKRDLLAENVTVDRTAGNEMHHSEIAPTHNTTNSSKQEVSLYREEEHTAHEHISVCENPGAEQKTRAGEQKQSNDKNQRLKPGALQAWDKEMIELPALQSKDTKQNEMTAIGDCNPAEKLMLATERKEDAVSDTGLYTGTAGEKKQSQLLEKGKESVTNAALTGADEGTGWGLSVKDEHSKVQEMSKQKVRDRKEILATIEKDFVRINVFAVTREVDTEQDHCTLGDEGGKEDMASTMKGKEDVRQESVLCENMCQGEVASEEEAQVKGELLGKEKRAATDGVTVRERYRGDQDEPERHNEKESHKAKAASTTGNVTEEPSEQIAPVQHDHDGPGAGARKEGDKHKETGNKNHFDQEVVKERGNKTEGSEVNGSCEAAVAVRAAVHAKEESEGPEEEGGSVRSDSCTAEEPAPPQATLMDGSPEREAYISSTHGAPVMVEHAEVESAAKNRDKPFKLPTAETAPSHICDTESGAELVVLTRGERADVPRRNGCCTQDTNVANDNSQLQPLSRKDHDKAAKSHHKLLTLDAHNNRPVFPVKEHSNTTVLASSECRMQGVLGRKKSDAIEECVKLEVAPKMPDITVNVSALVENTEAGVPREREDAQVGIPAIAECNKLGVSGTSQTHKEAVPLSVEYTKPGKQVTPEISEPGVLLTSEIPQLDTQVASEISKLGGHVSREQIDIGLSVTAGRAKQDVNEHPKPRLPVRSKYTSSGKTVATECTKPGYLIRTEHTGLEVSAIIDHPQLGVALQPDHKTLTKPIITGQVKSIEPKQLEYAKSGLPAAIEYDKPYISVKQEHSKLGLPVTMEHPSPSKPAAIASIKPGMPVSGEPPKINVPVIPDHDKPGKPVLADHTKPGKSVTADHTKPGVCVTADLPKPSVPVIPDHPKPGKPLTVDHTKPGVPVTTNLPKPSVPVIPDHPKPGKPLTIDHTKPGVLVTADLSKPNVPVIPDHPKPGKPATIHHIKSGVPVTAEPPKPNTDFIADHTKPQKPVTVDHTKPGVPVTANLPKPSVPVIPDHHNPGKPLTIDHTKPGVLVTVQPPKPSERVIPDHPKPDILITADHVKRAVPVRVEIPKSSTPTIPEDAKLGKPKTLDTSKTGVHMTVEARKSCVAVMKDHGRQGVLVVADPTKPNIFIMKENSATGVPVTRELAKQHDVPVSLEYTKPGIPVMKEGVQPGIAIKPEYSKTDILISNEHTKSSVPVRTQQETFNLPISKVYPKPGLNILKEHPKFNVSLGPECPNPSVHAKLNVPVSNETFSTDSCTSSVILTGKHATSQVPFKKECLKQNISTFKDHNKVETFVNSASPLQGVLLSDYCQQEVQNAHLSGKGTVSPFDQSKPGVNVSEEYQALAFQHEDHLSNHTVVSKYFGDPNNEAVSGNHSKSMHLCSTKECKVKEKFSENHDCHYYEHLILSGHENINKGKDYSRLPGHAVANTSIHQRNSQHVAPSLPLHANARKELVASLRQPAHVEATRKPLRDLYMSLEGAHRTLAEESKDPGSLANTFFAVDRKTEAKGMQEETEGLQYYSINSYETEAETRDVAAKPPQRTERVQSRGGTEPSASEREESRWANTFMESAKDHMPALQPDALSPLMGKPFLFKVKDNTFRASPVTKAVKPHFHKMLMEDTHLTPPASSEKGEDQLNDLRGHAEVPVTVHHAATLSDQQGHIRAHPARSVLSPPDLTTVKEAHAYMRKNLQEEDECCSVASVFSEDVESCAASAVGMSSDMAGVLRRTEASDAFRGTTGTHEVNCTDNEGRAQGKPPVVPPKTDKALRRAQKLTTRRMRRSEVKGRAEAKSRLDQMDVRAVSSVPSSPTEHLVSNLPTAGSPAGTRFCIEPGFIPPTTNLVAQPFSLTQRKLLQDPNSGQYFVVDMPVQVKTKTFFDPQTGKYVQLSVRQSPEGTLSPATSMELLRPPYVLYPGFLPLPVPSLPTLRSTSQMSAPAALVEDQERPEPWGKVVYQQGYGRDVKPYIGPACEKPLNREGKNTMNPRNLNIISMSELEDFAMEST